jgi:hypothetical protein
VAGLVLSGEPLLSNVHRGRVSHFVPYNVLLNGGPHGRQPKAPR